MISIIILTVVSAACSVVFSLLLPRRLWQLHSSALKTLPNRRGWAKVVIALLLLSLQVVNSIVLLLPSPPATVTGASLFYATASLIACMNLCPLLFLEHGRSVRPSDLAVLYLLASLLCDATQLGVAIYSRGSPSLAFSYTIYSTKLLLLIIECQGKKSILRNPYRRLPPEQLAGVLDRTFFWWINAILIYGSKSILSDHDLPPIDQDLSSKLLRRKALLAWDQRAKPENKATLPNTLVLALLWPFVSPILPRLFIIAFRYSQPILIGRAIRYMNKPPPPSQSSEPEFLLLLATIVIYVGIAVSTAVYQHRLNRLKIMVRGSLVGLIHNRALNMRDSTYGDGRAVTLISTDTDNILNTPEMFHETWARVIEVVIGMTMLARVVGWAWPVPLVIIAFCSQTSRYVAKNLKDRQRGWNKATQKRIAMTSSVLSASKNLKILGITTYVESLIQNLRIHEIEMANRVRRMMVAYTASANALGIFSPFITLVLFALLARRSDAVLDTETAFTTIAILGMVTHPANMIMTIMPQAVAYLADFERIQQYLLEPSRCDGRQVQQRIDGDHGVGSRPAIHIEDISILNSSSKPILQNISLIVNQGSLVICSGPVGCGKTALVKAIIGEFPVASGRISVSSKRTGLCMQTTWLPSTTIKEAICGLSKTVEVSSGWYGEVVRHCCLDEDLLALPDGDKTQIGSRGLNLSGGQRQRVALARVVYARCDIVVLDDIFSALDGKTENHIVQFLLGPDGLFKKMGTAVFLITNNAKHYRFADRIVVLGDSTIKHQGTWDSLASKPGRHLKLILNDAQDSSSGAKPQPASSIDNEGQQVAAAAMDLSRRTGDTALYGYYIKSFGYWYFFILVACTAVYSFFVTFPQYWIKWWTEADPSYTSFYAGGYLLLCLIAWTSTCGTVWSTYILIAPKSGAILHQRLLSTILGASLSYFSTTDTGSILNRFSQDIQLVDRQLPQATGVVINQIFKLLVQAALLFSAQRLISLTLPLCIGVMYFVQNIYLQTSRQLRLLELESQAEIYKGFLESIEGVTTIRAFGWEKEVENHNIECLDISQKPFYLLACLQRWLNIVLDLMVAAIATGVMIIAIDLKGTTSGGQLGVALNIVLVANTTLLRVIESWTTLEISLGGIARLKSVVHEVPQEDHLLDRFEPVEAWPSSGAVEFQNVTVAYNSENIALRGINLKILPGQRVVICGRTGSGKSTLLLSLLRVLNTQSGTIKIDGVDLSHVPRSLLRQRCFITVPQDPLILGQATLRFNVDPSESLPDASIIIALQKTCLWPHFILGLSKATAASTEDNITRASPHNILDLPITSLPYMSTGQLQLFSLARAILQAQIVNSKSSGLPRHFLIKPILLLDEATSSFDPETESVISDLIHEEFTQKQHTVIAITHKSSGIGKDTKLGRDIVVWMSNGQIEKIGAAEDILGSVPQDV